MGDVGDSTTSTITYICLFVYSFVYILIYLFVYCYFVLVSLFIHYLLLCTYYCCCLQSKTTKKRTIFGNAKKPTAPKLDEADDYSHLPPNPQKKMINDRIEAIQREVSQNQASLNAIKHMLDIYEKNPALGNVRQVSDAHRMSAVTPVTTQSVITNCNRFVVTRIHCKSVLRYITG